MKKVIFVLCFLLLATGCKSQGELKGEVFIVTKGGQNVKLGLVDITAVPEKDIASFIEEKKKSTESERPNLQKAYDEAKSQYDEAKRQYDDATSQWKAALDRESNSRIDEITRSSDNLQRQIDLAKQGQYSADLTSQASADVRAAADRKAMDSHIMSDKESMMAEKAKIADQKSDAMKAAKSKLDSWPSPDFLFKEIPLDKGIAKTTTDSDGKFSLKLPLKGKYAVVAHSQRQVPGETEEYYWLVWVSLNEPEAKIMLSNNNLIISDNPDVIMKAGATTTTSGK